MNSVAAAMRKVIELFTQPGLAINGSDGRAVEAGYRKCSFTLVRRWLIG